MPDIVSQAVMITDSFKGGKQWSPRRDETFWAGISRGFCLGSCVSRCGHSLWGEAQETRRVLQHCRDWNQISFQTDYVVQLQAKGWDISRGHIPWVPGPLLGYL